MSTKALKEVENALRKLSSNHKPGKWAAKNYIGAGISKLEFLDIKIPLVRKLYSGGFSFSTLSSKEQWLIWDYIWQHSNTFETMLMASYWANRQPIEDLVKNARIIFRWVEKVDNWAHSDELSSHCSKILESNHEKFLPHFEKWSRSKKPWLRRQSLVGLLFYSRCREKTLPFSVIMRFIDRQMHDNDFYVQKAVGWTLRECWNLYPAETYRYLKENAKFIPAAGWTAATEKLSKDAKAKLTALRKSI